MKKDFITAGRVILDRNAVLTAEMRMGELIVKFAGSEKPVTYYGEDAAELFAMLSGEKS